MKKSAFVVVASFVLLGSVCAQARPAAPDLNSVWKQLRDTFPMPSDGLPGLDPATEAGTANPDEIWVDGQVLGYLAGSMKEGDPRLQQIFDHLMGVRVDRGANELHAALYLDTEMQFSLAAAGAQAPAGWGKPYAFALPSTLRFDLTMASGTVTLSGLDEGASAPRLLLHLSPLPDEVYLRSATINLTSGEMTMEVGVIGDAVAVVAHGKLPAVAPQSYDVWKSIAETLNPFSWPALSFLRK